MASPSIAEIDGIVLDLPSFEIAPYLDERPVDWGYPDAGPAVERPAPAD